MQSPAGLELPDAGGYHYQQQRDDDEAAAQQQQQQRRPPPMQQQQQQQGHVGGHQGEAEWDPETAGQALLSSEPEWRAISNLDAFFTKVYTYYVEKGFWCMIATRITNIVTLAFTICFSSFLLLFINWHALLFCSSSSSCDDVVRLRSNVFSSPTTGDVVVFIYFALFALYWCWTVLGFVYALRDAFEMRAFFRDDLGIADDDLVSLEWHYVLDSLVALQAQGRRLCIVRELSALDITNRIMRKDNFFIAMINLNLFQLGPRNKLGVWNATPLPDWAGIRDCCQGNESRVRQDRQVLKEQRKQLRERKAAGHTVSVASGLDRGAAAGGGRAVGSGTGKQPLLLSDSQAESMSVFEAAQGQEGYHSLGSPSAAGPSGAGASGFPSSSPLSASGRGASGGARRPRIHSGSLSSWWSWAMLGTTLEWNLRLAVLYPLFDSSFHVNTAYLGARGINSLKRRFVWLGVANLVLSPFILLFMLIFFFLRHAEELHSKRSLGQGPRAFSVLAQWKMREFNELPHFFERRLRLAGVAAQQYMSQFPNNLLSIVASGVAYMSGAVVAILLLLTVTDSDAITHRLWDRTLLWYLAVFSALLAGSRAMVPEKSVYPSPALVMAEVQKHTHYSPPHWRGRTHTREVHGEFAFMYPNRLALFLHEILSVAVTPFILMFCLPHSAERVVQFVAARTVEVQGVGHLCAYAMFDLDRDGDTKYGNPAAAQGVEWGGGQHVPGAANGEAPGNGSIRPSLPSSSPRAPLAPAAAFPLRPRQGKLEKSFLSFSMHNPHWRAEPEGPSAVQGGQRFLQGIAESIVSGLPRGGGVEEHPGTPGLSRESSEHNEASAPLPSSGATPRKFRPAGSRLLPHISSASSASAAAPRLPAASPPSFARQDSLDSNTTDESSGGGADREHEDIDPHHPDGAGAAANGGQGMRGSVAASSASYVLSQSDRHLIQSFADLVGLDPAGASALHPSVLMRQSSWGASLGTGTGGIGGGASALGMSTFGLTQRRGHSGGGGGNTLLRSQFINSSSNSVLLGSTLLPRQSGTGGLQGGLTSSALLHMDPQSMREQLMLAQADQQADLFAMLQARAEEAAAEAQEQRQHRRAAGEDTVPEEDEDAEEEEEMEQPRQQHRHQEEMEERKLHPHPAPSQPLPATLFAAHPAVAQSYASASPPQSAMQESGGSGNAGSIRSHPSPEQQPHLHLQRQLSDDNEPPPMSFFEPAAR